MTRGIRAVLLAIGVVSMGGADSCDPLAPGNAFVVLGAPLASTGADADARGSVAAMLGELSRSVEVTARGLAPGAEYSVRADGVTIGLLRADDKGGARLRLSGDDVDFDPRGREIEVGDDSGPVLRASFAAAGTSAGATLDERVRLAPTAAAGGGQAVARFRVREGGRRSFSVELEDVPNGGYELRVGGVVRGTIQVAAGRGELEFDTNDPPKPLLDFEPRGAAIEVRRNGTAWFAGNGDGAIPGVEACTASELEEFLTPAAGGKAKARLRSRAGCSQDFRVEVEDVPAGSYQLLVGGVVRGTIVVALDPIENELEGELEFDSRPGEAGKLLLDFDPLGQPIEIRQGATLRFSLASYGSGGGPGGGPTVCAPDETRVPLAATAAAPRAKGEARLRVRDDCREGFRVEIEDVADGAYTLRVGGAVRGTITVVAGQGELEFDTADPPKPLLDFAVRGALVEVVRDGSVLLRTTFPSN